MNVVFQSEQGQTRPRHSSRAGFTLPEMVIAAFIMAFGLSVFTTTLTMSSKAIYTGRNHLVAMNYARREVEQRRLLAYGDPQLAVGTYSVTNSLYSGQIVISSVGASTSNLKSVSARITWKNNANNVTTNAQYTTILCNALH